MAEEDKESNQGNNAKPIFGATGRKIIYDKDGKPCRTCNSLLDFQMVTHGPTFKTKKPSKETSASATPKPCPPDVEEIGKSSWTLLHSIAATYPENPSNKEQSDLKQFMKLFGNFYPCWYCRDDFVEYSQKSEPKVETQDAFGRWLCDAHNEVNVKLGKEKFDCNLWKQRWKDGWKDGSCD
ncbi:DEHA2A12826p [Debaryomyces hansenii CBS767]|uniref:Sulfhydryl oxidase n=1 Tax=Debaryomyces hansenii (strain ATCC 36239 / CBS 767 / BCRC 21394 / JCM 1990 / NBRC 0083 / IGC 2968) TaxID=284592 RepID=Q6BY33_DEBHA|nr:DEHA2A12826p [Debaryomyces hansenii CBS767]CAG84863.1 DEHA2A12826p [Debaryomyces hansenii CBS767]|eukprot:XP_456886.1 DEHA2A12826p [Debaryomyces hansenii CBS767]